MANVTATNIHTVSQGWDIFVFINPSIRNGNKMNVCGFIFTASAIIRLHIKRMLGSKEPMSIKRANVNDTGIIVSLTEVIVGSIFLAI